MLELTKSQREIIHELNKSSTLPKHIIDKKTKDNFFGNDFPSHGDKFLTTKAHMKKLDNRVMKALQRKEIIIPSKEYFENEAIFVRTYYFNIKKFPELKEI